jgi:Flp pilus assembly protein TadB
MAMLFNDKLGQMMMGAAVAMQAIGWIWIKQVVKIEV